MARGVKTRLHMLVPTSSSSHLRLLGAPAPAFPRLLDRRSERGVHRGFGINWSVVLALTFNFTVWVLLVAGVVAVLD